MIGQRRIRHCRGRAQGEILKARGIECRLLGGGRGGLNHRGRDEGDKAVIRQDGGNTEESRPCWGGRMLCDSIQRTLDR